MKLIEMFMAEAPIEDLNMVGDWSKNSSFRHETDRKLLTNPKAQAKIIHKWANTVVPFSLNFVNFPGAGKFLEQGEVSMDWLQQNMPKVLPQLKISDEAVNIIFTNNSGAERVPMTAWILAHRFGHALQRFQKNYEFQEYMRHMERIIKGILADAYNLQAPPPLGYGRSDADYQRIRSFDSAILAFMEAIGTFKSARENNVRNVNEWYLEVLAQYMLAGQVTFNPIPRSFDFGRKAWGRSTNGRGIKPDMYDDVNDEIQMLARDAGYYCEQIMHSAVGRIYVM
jgi:hypothetical protein